MISINLTQQQLQNLILFLNRVQLQGSEATALVELLLILRKQSQAIQLKPKEEEKKEEKK